MARFTQEDIEAIQESSLFDSNWYLQEYPDVKALELDPVLHYLKIGTKLGRRPSPLFNPNEYLKANPDVEKAGVEPLLHYVRQGKSEGRIISPNGDARALEVNGGGSGALNTADVAIKQTVPGQEEKLHRVMQATRITLDASARQQYDIIAAAFEASFYVDRYPDIAEAFTNSEFDPVKHYIDQGTGEGRDPCEDFDTRYYLDKNPDVKESGINPFYHYLIQGREEGRPAMPVVRKLVENQYSEGGQAPHYGVVFRNLVNAAISRTKTKGVSSEYRTIRSEFDFTYYLIRNQDLARAKKIDVVQHYINAGAREGRNPSPLFSTKHYVERYPEVIESGLNPFYHWLTIGRDKGYMALPFKEFDQLSDILGLTAQQCQNKLVEKYCNLRDRLEHGKLGEMAAKAAELDPLVAQSWPEALNIKIPPFNSDNVVSRIAVMHRLQSAALFRRARFVITVNRPRWGCGRRAEGYLAHALAEKYDPDEVLIIYTNDSGPVPTQRFPDGCRQIHFSTLAGSISHEQRMRVLVEFMRSLRPEAIFNVNSGLMWDSYKSYGKALASSSKLYAYLFCNEQTIHGYWTGYPVTKFYRYFDMLSGILVDSNYLNNELTTTYMVPPDQRNKISVMAAPVDMSIPVAQEPRQSGVRRPQVFWSGRFDRQKRTDIVYELARKLPGIDFRLWGSTVLDKVDMLTGKPANVVLEGSYEEFQQLPLNECDLWLYTSEWDGVPHILLEVAMTGLPIVSSLVGGTGEVLLREMSWPIADFENIEAYKNAIEDILSNPVTARKRAQRLREAVSAQRNKNVYGDALQTVLSLTPEASRKPAAMQSFLSFMRSMVKSLSAKS